MSNSALAYAVHGFFTNGGQQLYVGRVASKTAKKATVTTDSGITATAKYEGAWGNDVVITIKKSADWVENTNEIFDVVVSIGSSDSAVVSEVTIDTMVSAVMSNAKISNWLGEFSISVDYTKIGEETIKRLHLHRFQTGSSIDGTLL